MTDKEFLNLPVGRTFVLGNRTLKVVEGCTGVWCNKDCYFKDCDGCYFLSMNGIIPRCGDTRTDKKSVHFEEVK